MILDLYQNQLPEILNTDVCIIGAGAAGIPLALDLGERHHDIVMLESGGIYHEADVHSLNHADVVGLPHHGVHDGRFRAFGGTTTQWGGQILPLDPIAFDARPWVQGSGWPIPYAEILPYYEKSTSFVGLGESIHQDAQVWQRIGLETPKLGDGIEPYFSRWCPEPNFAKQYRNEVELSKRLQCVLHATVVSFCMTNERVTAVFAKSLRGQSIKVLARRFVICVGAIETPRLLLQPLDTKRPAPWADSKVLEPFREVLIQDEVAVNRRSMSRIMARRMKATALRA